MRGVLIVCLLMAGRLEAAICAHANPERKAITLSVPLEYLHPAAVDGVLQEATQPENRLILSYFLADQALDFDNFPMAAEYFKVFMETDPESFFASEWLFQVAYQEIARTWWNMGQEEDAIDLLRRAAEKSSHPAPIRQKIEALLP